MRTPVWVAVTEDGELFSPNRDLSVHVYQDCGVANRMCWRMSKRFGVKLVSKEITIWQPDPNPTDET